MVRLALRTIWVRKIAFVASFLALLLGGVIVMTCGALMETGIVSSVPPARLAAASVVVSGSREFTEPVQLPSSDVAKAAAVPGAGTVVGDVSFPAYVVRGSGDPIGGDTSGHAWASARLGPYTVTKGSAPDRSGEVTLDRATADRAGVAVGDTVRLSVSGRSTPYTLSGVTSGPRVDGGVVFLADADAARVQPHPGTVDAIGVIAKRGTSTAELASALSKALPGTVALTGDDRGTAEFTDISDSSETLIVIAAVFGGLAVMVEIFIVASVLGLSMQQRAREHALLRAIGAQPRQLRRLVLGETFLITVVATAVAYLPNEALARFLLKEMGKRDVVNPAIRFEESWVPIAAGAGVALLSALVAAYVAARPAVRARPVEALAAATLRTRWLNWPRGLFATLFLAGAGALTLVTAIVMRGPVAASTGGPTAMLWAIGLALLGPGVVRVTFAVLRVPMRAVTGMTGGVAMVSATRRRVQLAGAVMPIMLATGLGTALIYMQTTQTAVAEDLQTKDLKASAALTSDTGGLPLDLVGTVRKVPGVAAATGVVSTSGYLESLAADDKGNRDVYPIQGITAAGASDTVGVTMTSGSLDDLTGDTVVIPQSEAEDGNHTVGDEIPVYLGDNTELRMKIVGTYDAAPGYEQLYLPADRVVQHTRTGLAAQILVAAAPSVSRSELDAALTRAVRDRPGVEVAGQDALRKGVVTQEQTGVWVNYLLVAMIIGYAVISLVNSLVVATAERRREFALQRLVGATRSQIMRMAAVESTLVGVAGAVLGVVVAGTTLIAFDIALGGSVWPQGSPWIAAAVFGGSFALTVFTTLLTTGHVSRAHPIEAAEAV